MEYKEPKRRFEKSGFVDPAKSYYVPLENVTNVDNDDIKTMVDRSRYFSIFAPRQSGKTTFFKAFSRNLEEDSEYIFILLSFEDFSKLSVKEFYKAIEEEIYSQLIKRLKQIKCPQLELVLNYLETHRLTDNQSFKSMFRKLNEIINQKKIVIFIDEFDGIPEEEIGSFLTTLRKLYQEYKDKDDKALYSVGLVGIRNITKLTVGGVSPFNIADHVELPAFSLKNIRDLYGQYTEETNQAFSEEAVQKIFDETSGQPWLVNRLGSILTSKIKSNTTETIMPEDVDNAIHMLLKEDNKHFENLYEKILLFKKSFIEILNNDVKHLPDNSSQSWLRQFGLVKEKNDKAVVANQIYKKRFVYVDSDKTLVAENQQKKLFISYSRKDKIWLEKIVNQLKTLEHSGFEIWFDEKIRTGEEWGPEIENAIETSQIAICLISTNFLASDFIRTRELPAILNKHKEGLILFPILITQSAWKAVPWLKKLQLFPKDSIPLVKKSEAEQEEVLIDIVNEICEIFL